MYHGDHELYSNAAGHVVFIGGLIDRVTMLEKILTHQEQRFDDCIIALFHLEQQAEKSKEFEESQADWIQKLREQITAAAQIEQKLRAEIAKLKADAEAIRQAKP